MNKFEEYQYWTEDVDPDEYSHVLIFFDPWNHSKYCKYVERGEDYKEVIKKELTSWENMSTLEDVYVLKEELSFDIMDDPDIKEAYKYAKRMHAGTLRKNSNKEYITHPENVANLIFKYKKSHNIKSLIIAALLHDTLEDTNATYYELVDKFGGQIASIVLELTTDEDLKQLVGKTNYLKIKMKNMSSWALVIKLCDRLDNVSDLVICDDSFKIKYTKETIDILDFLTTYRKLSDTHLTLVREILNYLQHIINNNFENLKDYNNTYINLQKKLSIR